MVYVIDIDGILCDAPSTYTLEAFRNRVLNKENIEIVNKLYDEGHQIILFTARMSKDKGVKKVTVEWLKKYEVKYHELRFDKPKADVYVDDKATCNFPERRKLYMRSLSLTKEICFFCYLHTKRASPKEAECLPDRYVVRISNEGTVAEAKGEFLRDRDLKEEALMFVSMSISALRAGAQHPFPGRRTPGETEQ